VPFKNFTWAGDHLALGDQEPEPELRQTGDNSFVILHSFCYVVAPPDPEEGKVYVIPGADMSPDDTTHQTTTVPGVEPVRQVVVPPSTGGKTDLASVPSFMWWLIASYGNHTRAALLHDSLYVDSGVAPVPRKTADRLFLTALREPEQKTGVFRHWLMWAAVSAFGNMRRILGVLFALQVLAIWILVIGGIAWEWGPSLSWWEILLALAALVVFLLVSGTGWRAGVDFTGGWLLPTALLAAAVVIPLVYAWPSSFHLGWTPFTLFFVAAVLFFLGLPWGIAVDPGLRWWLWPTTMIGMPIALLPVALILVAVRLVWFIDLGAAVAAAARTDQYGNPRDFELPRVTPYRVLR
jgi:Protein of unknown function (DUF1353)